MHSLRCTVLALVCALLVVPFAMAGNPGMHETGTVAFANPVRVGGTLLPAGEYMIRHSMEGQEHMMIFQALNHKVQDVKVKCQLVQLGAKAHDTRTVYELNASNERVLHELVFAGDSVKHVF